MTNKVLISRDHRSKYCNPNSPRHCGHYVSPIPDANSSIYDSELQQHERDLSLREEKYLLDLKKFYDGVEKHKRFKFELDELKKQLQNHVFTIEETENRINYFRQILNDRAKNAELVLSLPVQDYSDEDQALLELEKEVKKLEDSLPEDPMGERTKSVAQMLSDAQEMEINNIKLAEELEQKKQKIEKQKTELNMIGTNIQEFEIEEEKLIQIALNEKAQYDSLPKINWEEILAQERLKEDLQMRKKKIKDNTQNFKIKTNRAANEIETLQIEIQHLDKEFNEISKNRKLINDLLFRIHQANEGKQQLELLLLEKIEELNQVKHVYENQQNEIWKIENKKKSLKKSFNDKIEKEKRLNVKERELKDRREILTNIENQFSSNKDNVNKMKIRISTLERDVEKYEKQAKSQIEKVNNLQEQLQDKQDEIVYSPSTSSLQELKELIDKAEGP